MEKSALRHVYAGETFLGVGRVEAGRLIPLKVLREE